MPAPGRDIVLVVVCTLRADHLPFYGYERDTAPFLSQVAQGAAVFDRAHSTSSWTAPATGSILTGRYPLEHGLLTGLVQHRVASKSNPELQVPSIRPDVPTLAERLRDAGYETWGLAQNPNVSTRAGLDRGFDRFKNIGYRGAESSAEMLRSWVEEAEAARPPGEGRRPRFVFLQLLDPHAPYRQRPPFFETGDRPFIGAMGVGPADPERIAAYDSEIHHVDTVLEGLWEELNWADEHFVLTSDHGEAFGEHGRVGHGATLQQELVRVPLLVREAVDGRRPEGPRRVRSNVSVVDLVSTLLELAGAEPLETSGRSLVPDLGGSEPEGDRTLLMDFRRLRATGGWSLRMRAAVSGPWKYVRTDPRGRERLFHLRRDPGETRNAASRRPDVVRRLRAAVADYDRIDPGRSVPTVTVDPELRRELEALGYVGGAGGHAVED